MLLSDGGDEACRGVTMTALRARTYREWQIFQAMVRSSHAVTFFEAFCHYFIDCSLPRRPTIGKRAKSIAVDVTNLESSDLKKPPYGVFGKTFPVRKSEQIVVDQHSFCR